MNAIKGISFELLLILVIELSITTKIIIVTVPVFPATIIGVDVYSDAAAAAAGATTGTVCKLCFADCSCASKYAL